MASEGPFQTELASASKQSKQNKQIFRSIQNGHLKKNEEGVFFADQQFLRSSLENMVEFAWELSSMKILIFKIS
jgi:hypothetical protein